MCYFDEGGNRIKCVQQPSEYIPNWISKIEFPQLFQIFALQLFGNRRNAAHSRQDTERLSRRIRDIF